VVLPIASVVHIVVNVGAATVKRSRSGFVALSSTILPIGYLVSLHVNPAGLILFWFAS